MLIEFRVANFRSFRDEQVLSLVASKDETHSGNVVRCDGFGLLKAAAIYGPNASGKSNLVKAIECMKKFVEDSATKMNLGDRIPGMAPHRLAEETVAQPSRFSMTFLHKETRFEYGFTATAERVHAEWLFAHPAGGRKQRWFERSFDQASATTTWVFRGPLKRTEKILKERTRDNGLVLSRGAELNIGPLRDPFLWFDHLKCLDVSGDYQGLTKYLIKLDAGLLRQVVRLLRHADVGIDDVRLPESGWSIRTVHRLHGTDREELFEMEDESKGTQRLFELAGELLYVLDCGAVLVIDELDCSMHPLLTYKLLELFQSPEVNPKGAQIVFATHDSTLMDPQLLRRDQIWLVEKDRGGSSKLRSLYDFSPEEQPRNTEAFQRNYLAGRYGGVPSFGPTFENLTLK